MLLLLNLNQEYLGCPVNEEIDEPIEVVNSPVAVRPEVVVVHGPRVPHGDGEPRDPPEKGSHQDVPL